MRIKLKSAPVVVKLVMLHLILWLVMLTGLILSSCTRINLVDQGQVTLTVDWSNRTQGLGIPDQYHVRIADKNLVYREASNTLPSFYPGDYQAVVYNRAQGVSVDDTEVIVAQHNNMLLNLPGWIFATVLDIPFRNDTQHTVTVEMKQQVRSLTIVLRPKGGSVARILAIKASLQGIAGRWDIVGNGPVGEAMAVPLDFVKQADGTWSATVRILGVFDDQQRLKGVVSFTDGMPSDLWIDADLSDDFQDFNKNKAVPLSLLGSFETQTEVGFEVTINDWEQVSGSGNAW